MEASLSSQRGHSDGSLRGTIFRKYGWLAGLAGLAGLAAGRWSEHQTLRHVAVMRFMLQSLQGAPQGGPGCRGWEVGGGGGLSGGTSPTDNGPGKQCNAIALPAWPAGCVAGRGSAGRPAPAPPGAPAPGLTTDQPTGPALIGAAAAAPHPPASSIQHPRALAWSRP